MSPDGAAPKPAYVAASITCAPSECIAAVVPDAPRVSPDKVLPLLELYV